MRTKRAAALLLTVASLGTLTACSSTVALESAEYANDPGCAEIIVRLPHVPDLGLEQRTTNAQGTAAWGEPATVLLRCGIQPPGPSTLPCFTVDGIDWLLDESNAEENIFRFLSYGREPATEVIVDTSEQEDGTATAGVDVLRSLSTTMSVIPPTARCVESSDVFEG